ncbi:M23 family metallopeptidase [Corallococcus sp. M34]|uniref:M23 family metallopeptidase n=1 Tax=Citreicoccus inhibens TaxID=2849499 RepID=UPI001C22527D|nr:M23 family metallopeptidase [Citreicoccus inhibens]MBU8897689.1 M23 family metallopeptidase [Citreicoccus inhibens]
MFLRRSKGLLDFAMAVLCIWAAYHHTPAGALARRAGAWALGVRTSARPLLAYYDGGADSEGPAAVGAPEGALAHPLSDEEALAWGVHLALTGMEPRARERALGAAEALGLTPSLLLDAREGPGTARRLLTLLTADFPGEEARLTAAFAGTAPARYAVERVRAEGQAPTLERLARQLPPGFESASTGAARALALATAFALAWPVPEGTPVTSPFGYRVHPVLGTRKLHTGVDLGVRSGTSVVAVASGVVRRASEDAVNGRVLVVDHGRGVTTAYCHNSELLVRVGERIERGQVIAHSGSTGRSTGPHLHYQLELAAQPVDPLCFRTHVRVAGGATEL